MKNIKEVINSLQETVASWTATLRFMIQKRKSEPPHKMIFPGIKENSMGFVFGPSKSCKTIFCEGLAMSIAAGLDSYLGSPIDLENRKVLFLSLEEFPYGRTERNEKQVQSFTDKVGNDNWLDNFIVASDTIKPYIETREDWAQLRAVIIQHQPGIVFIDSMSRLYSGQIEDSKIAKEAMKELRTTADKTGTTLCVIHHTPKMNNASLTIESVAGSRMVGQEADFMIGINKLSNGTRYIKGVAFRYAPDDNESVKVVELNPETLLLEFRKEMKELRLLSGSDGRSDDTNMNKVYEFLSDKATEAENGEITQAVINEHFKDEFSVTTVYNLLNKLIKDEMVVRASKGVYKLAS